MRHCKMAVFRSVSAGLIGLCALAGIARAQALVTIPAEDLNLALEEYIRRTGVQLIYNADQIAGLRSHPVTDAKPSDALDLLLEDTGMAASHDRSGAVVLSQKNDAHTYSYNALDVPESIVVTGTRILASSVPTPVTTMTVQQLEATTPQSIPQALAKLPIFMQGSTPDNAAVANGRGYNAPGYFLNLRDLGAIRTLILEDGHRVPGTFYDTTVDVDMLPQMLVQRVEIATGGSSAVYGSDAVTGVVNFILDKQFEGLKGLMEGGISQYGDTRSLRLGMAGGEDIGRGHLVWSLEYHDRDAIADDGARPLGLLGASVVGAGTAASPYVLVTGIRQANAAPGGLIVTGPGTGQQFLNNGSLAPFNPGIPTATANASIGGDGGIVHDEYLLPAFATAQGFAHYEYNVDADLTAYAEARYAMARSFEAEQIFTNINGSNTVSGCTYVSGICSGTPSVGYTANGSSAQYPITIYSSNPFLTSTETASLFPGAPASCLPGASFIATASATACPSFQMNRMDNDLMSRLSLDLHTGALALSGGLRGRAFADFTWDFNYTHGETRTQETTRNNIDTAKFYAALDAVRDPSTGNIVCNVSLTAPGAFPGCVPLDLFGQGNASQAALNYVGDTTYWVAHNGMDDFSANLTGTAWEGWAGPIKLAVGGEYRLASLNVTTTTPNNSFNPQYLRLAPPGTFASTQASPSGTFPASDLSLFKEVESGALGSENIAEGNIELDVPLLRDLPGIQALSANGAARYTHYAASGIDPTGNGSTKVAAGFAATTWKIGAEWQIVDDVKFRGAYSRDIRAPTLFDLFQGPVTSTSGISDSLTDTSGSANTSTVGNPNLHPEVARNTTAGVVLTPSALPGFSMSADFYHIKIDNEIATIGGGDSVVQSLCLASPGGTSPYCGLIVRPISYNNPSPLNFPQLFYSQARNAQTQWTEGADLEASYATDLSTWSDLKGLVTLHLAWSHVTFLKTALNLPGSVTTNMAGASAASTDALPADKINLTLDYALGGLSLDVLERYYSPLRQSSNPMQVFAIPDLPAYFITDLNVSYDFKTANVPVTAFVTIANLFNRQPDILQNDGYTGSPGLNYPVAPYEDVIGRYFTVGLKFKM